MTDINAVAIRRFERCVEKLEAVSARSGVPVTEMSNHPAVRPVLKEMKSLLSRIELEMPDFDLSALAHSEPEATAHEPVFTLDRGAAGRGRNGLVSVV